MRLLCLLSQLLGMHTLEVCDRDGINCLGEYVGKVLGMIAFSSRRKKKHEVERGNPDVNNKDKKFGSLNLFSVRFLVSPASEKYSLSGDARFLSTCIPECVHAPVLRLAISG